MLDNGPLCSSPSACGAEGRNEGLDRLVAAYPGALARHDGERLFWRDSTMMEVSDGTKDKSFDQLMKNASILDQFALPYRRGRPTAPPELNDDPGRFRNTAFLQKLYGDCRRGDVDRHMVELTWLPKSWGKTIRATNVEGVADWLKAISAEIEALPPAIRRAAFRSPEPCRAARWPTPET
jgi:hypothetical protein